MTGSLFRLAEAGIAGVQGDSDKVREKIDKAVEAIKRPPLSELSDSWDAMEKGISDILYVKSRNLFL